MDLADPTQLKFSMNPRWVAVHPVVLAMTACLATRVAHAGGSIVGEITKVPTLPYLIRMGLFEYLRMDPGRVIVAHEGSGRFVPLTRIKDNDELKKVILDIIPLLHAPPAVADPIRYVFSEMVRNALEHSNSPFGVIVCAQYYIKSKRIAIGIADGGDGVLQSMQRSHQVHTAQEAMHLALQPGITGVTRRIGGNETNAGAGLFFTKSISVMSRNRFCSTAAIACSA